MHKLLLKKIFLESTNQKISLENTNVSLYIKREDLLHPYVSGNKFRKLKYNLVQAKSENKKTLLTFGGDFSNHIFAVAAAVTVNAQAPTPSTEQNWTPSIEFDKETHDYGTVKHGGDGTCEFKFTNKSRTTQTASSASAFRALATVAAHSTAPAGLG